MTAIHDVTVTVRTDDGGAFTLVVTQPEPTGGNPAFLTKQLDAAMADLWTRHADVIRAVHGKQIGDES